MSDPDFYAAIGMEAPARLSRRRGVFFGILYTPFLHTITNIRLPKLSFTITSFGYRLIHEPGEAHYCAGLFGWLIKAHARRPLHRKSDNNPATILIHSCEWLKFDKLVVEALLIVLWYSGVTSDLSTNACPDNSRQVTCKKQVTTYYSLRPQ